MTDKKDFTEGLTALIEKFFGPSQKETPPQVEVTKSLDEEQRRALFVVLEPDVIDAHGDIYSAEEIEKACISFNSHCMKANLFHQIETEKAKIEQSFISPVTFTLDDERVITKGTWLQWYHFPKGDADSEVIWKAVQSGDINGVSVGCKATCEELK